MSRRQPGYRKAVSGDHAGFFQVRFPITNTGLPWCGNDLCQL
jgi:hypothetical protein